DTAMNWSASSRKFSRTSSTSARVILPRLAMAVPMRWTSRAERYLNTSAAASSPSESIRMAHCSRSLSAVVIFLHPRSDHHGNGTGVVLGQRPYGGQVVFVAIHLGGTALGFRCAIDFFLQLGGWACRDSHGWFLTGYNGFENFAPDQPGSQQNEQVATECHGIFKIKRVLPDG